MPHYFSDHPDTPHVYNDVTLERSGIRFLFRTDTSVFSRKRVDPGTEQLLDAVLKAEKNRKASVLDLGTGIGVLAIVLARLCPDFSVTGSDINARAVELARENAARNGARKAVFVYGDGVPALMGPFDMIVTNPPIRTGKQTVYRLFSESAAALAESGAFYCVIRVKQGAVSAEKELSRLFENVETIARGKGYHVICASCSLRRGVGEGQK